MRVITLTPQGLQEHCRRLACMVAESGYSPDVITGIHTGGYETALLMLPHMSGATLNGYRVSRASSRSRKRRWLQSIMRKLPLCLLNGMRIAEA
ncbi:MAG: hypothetical protein K2M76_02195, partial [Muribaculaceae bacterium]|nr:hypothetical protein [Muribaculaceae bacterium]